MIKMKLFHSVFLLFTSFSLAAIIHVPDEFNTIQSAINFSSDSDTILVEPGIYHENINFSGKEILLASRFLFTDDPEYISGTIIDGNELGSVITFNSGEGYSSEVRGFTITNGSTYNGGGIYCSGASPTIRNVLLTGNEAIFNGGGIICYFGSSPRLISVTITDNIAGSDGGAVYLWESHFTSVNSILWNNGPQEVFFHENGFPNSATIAYTNIMGGFDGVMTNSNGSVQWLEGNISENPLFRDAESLNYSLAYGSPCIDSGTNYFFAEGDTIVNLTDGQFEGEEPDLGCFEFFAIFGCTDENAANHNPDATIDDGSCFYIWGCTDEDAANYDPDAYYDDGSCQYSPELSPIDAQQMDEDMLLQIIINAWDPDSENIFLTAYSDTSAVVVTIVDDTLIVQPAPNWNGTSFITVIASDGTYEDQVSFLLTVFPVSDPPVLINPGNQIMMENTVLEILLQAVDYDDDLLYFSATSDSTTIGLMIVQDTLFISPAPNWYGQSMIYLTVYDGLYQENAEFLLTVNSAYDDVQIQFGELWADSNKVQIIIDSETDILGFQLQFTGENLLIDYIRGGLVDEYGFLIQFDQGTGIVLGFSPFGEVIPAGSGTLFNLYFDGWGNPELCMENTVITQPEGTEANVTTGDCLTIVFSIGDLNDDGYVDILDVVTLVNIVITGVGGDPFQLWAGDINEDGTLNITDIVMLVQIILGE